ncbi:hypothetical protein, partial [Streptomyces sp. NPDC005533]|uniref:hypothetical protein n=1 Tax=Streptomyces sp. NPDC005533 TaxID=3364723 RepID=UPI00368C626E
RPPPCGYLIHPAYRDDHRSSAPYDNPASKSVDTEGIGVFLQTDVGKTAHHGHGLTDHFRMRFGVVSSR